MVRRRHFGRAAKIAWVTCLLACSPDARPDGGNGAAPPAAFGHPDSVLFWTLEQQLAGFPNYDAIFSTRSIEPSENPYPLPSTSRDWSQLEYRIEGRSYGLDDFLEHNRVAGVIVVKDGTVVLEEYRLGHHPARPWVSYSVAKSVVSLLVGVAVQEGHIAGVGDRVTQYLPQLRGTAYEGVSLENVLQMASGVAWNEDYTDPSADVSLEIGMTDRERLAFIGSKPRATDPGTQFNYSTGETHLVGAVLRSAIDGSLAEFLASRIWGPFGMEHPANWRLVEPDGGEHGGCCISASLRDYARIGLFALGDGVLPDGRRVLPAGWMEASTAPSATNPGYGYLWWLSEDGYSARGIFGQGVFVFPEESTVVALHSAWPEPVGSDFSTHRDSFIEAVRRALAN